MILDGTFPGSSYDCFVIGSGPAGLTVALELAGMGKRVLVFESGPAEGDPANLSNSVGYGHFPGDYWNKHWVRKLGGTSAVWSGWCAPLNDIDFDNPAAGARWPFNRSVLDEYYKSASLILDRDPTIVDFKAPFLEDFSYKPFSVTTTPTRFGEKYAPVLNGSRLIDVAVHQSVNRIDAADGRRYVNGIRVYDHRSDTEQTVAIGPHQSLVVAAGGIGNAQLLLQPRSDSSVPVGNESGLVGKYLMEHPHFYHVGECVLEKTALDMEPPAAFARHTDTIHATQELATRQAMIGCSIQFKSAAEPSETARLLGELMNKPYTYYDIHARSEMAPSMSNEVFLTGQKDGSGVSKTAARCVCSETDLLNVESNLRTLGSALIKTNKGRLRIKNEQIYRRFTGGGHIMGTTRMGDDPAGSVVDANCRVHGYANFYIAGSSVFPTGGAANPTLTIVALALKLAAYVGGN